MGNGSPEDDTLGRIVNNGPFEEVTFERDLPETLSEMNHASLCGKGALAEGTLKVMALRGGEGLAVERQQEGQCSCS